MPETDCSFLFMSLLQLKELLIKYTAVNVDVGQPLHLLTAVM